MDPRGSMGDRDHSNAKISVWWDIENCAVPANVNPHCIAQNVNAVLSQANLNGALTIDAFGDTKFLQNGIQEALASTGITLNHVPRGNKDAADKAILVGILLWALDNPPPAHILLISGDDDFANALHRLRLKRYNVLLARPDALVKPALFQAATCVWYWTSLARGELSTSMSHESLEQPLLPQNTVSDGSSKEYLASGNGSYCISNSATSQRLNTQTFTLSPGSGNFSSQDLPLSKYKGGNGFASLHGGDASHVSNGSTEKGPGIPASTSSRGVVHSQFEKPYLQGDIKHTVYSEANTGYKVGPGVSPSKNSKPQHFVLASNEERYRPGKKCFPHYASNSTPPRPHLDFQADAKPGSSGLISYNPAKITQNCGNGVGIKQASHSVPLQSNYNEAGLSNLSSKQTSQVEMRHSPVMEGGSPLFPHPYTNEKSGDPASQKIPDLHKVSLSKVLKAMEVLKKDMLTPTEANLHDCVQHWEGQMHNFNLKKTLEKAVDRHELEIVIVKSGVFKIYMPPNSQLWSCVAAGNMQTDYSNQVWMVFRRFLLSKDGPQLLGKSQSRYDAAQILKKQGLDGFQSLAVGQVINLLQQAVEQKKWLRTHVSGWSPVSINLQALVDCRVSPAAVASLDLGQRQSGLVQPVNYSALQDNLRKDVIFQKLRTWLVETLKEKSDYDISLVPKDFEQATGIHLDHQKLGFAKLQLLIQKFGDIVCIEKARKGLLILRLVRHEISCKPLPSVKSTDAMEPGNQSLLIDQLGGEMSVETTNNRNSSKNKVIENLKSWLPYVMEHVQDGYDLSKIRGDFLLASGIDLDKYDLGVNKLQDILRSFSDIVHLEDSQAGVCLVYPASKKPGEAALSNVNKEIKKVAKWKEVNTMDAVPCEKMLSDCRVLLLEVLPTYNDGYPMAMLKPDFKQQFGYKLDYSIIGLPKLEALMGKFSDLVTVETAPQGHKLLHLKASTGLQVAAK